MANTTDLENMSSKEFINKHGKVAAYIQTHGSITFDDGTKYTKGDLKNNQKYIIDLTSKKKRKNSTNGLVSKAKGIPFYISDQLYNFFNEASYGIGISDFLKKNGYSENLNEDGSLKKTQDKVKAFLKKQGLYNDAKLYYREFLEVDASLSDEDVYKKVTNKQIDDLIDFKNQMDCILNDRIINNTLKISLISFIDVIRQEFNEKNIKRRLVNKNLETNFGTGTDTKFFIKGIEIKKTSEGDSDADLEKCGLTRLEDKQSKKDKDIYYIPKEKEIDGEYGYIHKALMILFSYYIISIKTFNLSEELQNKLKDEQFQKKLELLQKRIKFLKM